ncbi:MAG: hypothetical protein ACOCW8_03420 [bacterium]
MKKFYFFIMLSILAINLYAQAPEGFKYQAVLRNTSGEIKATTDAEVEIIILQGSANGTEVYAETHDITTNSYGLFTLGTLITGYGVSSVDNPETGYYTVNLENVYSGNPVVLVTCYNSTPSDEVATYSASQDDNKINVRLSDGAGSPIISVFSILVYGMPE